MNIEEIMLKLPQADCPVRNFFMDGIYIREVTLFKGTIALGHHQRFRHINILMEGKVLFPNGEIIVAPKIFIGEPGRKFGFILETVKWLNIYRTYETDLDKLEDLLFIKNENLIENEIDKSDNKDYELLLKEIGISKRLAKKQAENSDIPIELNYPNISIRNSDIEGKGIFLSYPVLKNEIIAPAKMNNRRTIVGRYINHSKKPNCTFVKVKDDIYLVSNARLPGCIGGNKGTELTVDYRQALGVNKCLE